MLTPIPKDRENRLFLSTDAGTKLIFKPDGHEGQIVTYEVLKATHKNGVAKVIIKHADKEPKELEINACADGLYIIDNPQESDAKHYILKCPFKNGDSWNSTRSLKDTEHGITYDVQCSYRVAFVGEIEVPAGRFSTVCIECTFRVLDSVLKKQSIWYAPDVGPVKIVEDGKTSVLTKIAKNK